VGFQAVAGGGRSGLKAAWFIGGRGVGAMGMYLNVFVDAVDV
jgi:hypothetical protein